MNFEALIVVPIVIVIFGIPLGIIGWLGARRYRKTHPISHEPFTITKAGRWYSAAMVVGLVAVTSWAYFHPDSVLGQLLNHGGILVVSLIAMLPFTIVAKFLEARGVVLFSKPKTNE
jgi:hypothetical protein